MTTSTKVKPSPSVNPDVYLWILQAREKLAKNGFHASADLDHTDRIALYQKAASALMKEEFDLIEWPFADSSYPLSIVQQPVYERLIAAAAYKREENHVLDSFYHKLENTNDEEKVLTLINVNLHTINDLAEAIHHLTMPRPVRTQIPVDQVQGVLLRNLFGLRDLVRQHINPKYEMALLVYEPVLGTQKPILCTTHPDLLTANKILRGLLDLTDQMPMHDENGNPINTLINLDTPNDNA